MTPAAKPREHTTHFDDCGCQSAALRARTRDAVVAGANWQKWHHGTYEPERQRAFEAIVARLLGPRSDTPEADNRENGDDHDA